MADIAEEIYRIAQESLVRMLERLQPDENEREFIDLAARRLHEALYHVFESEPQEMVTRIRPVVAAVAIAMLAGNSKDYEGGIHAIVDGPPRTTSENRP